jgi:UDP-N-acetylmuramyl tripeptide synthase
VDAGEDRELAIEKAVELLNEQDTVIFLSKAVYHIGQTLVTKDQLIFTRKSE